MTRGTAAPPDRGPQRCSSRLPIKASPGNLRQRRNRMKARLALLFAMTTLICAATTYAHHSFAATYDETKTITIKGKMVQFSFRNPHSFVQVEVTDGNGKVRWA